MPGASASIAARHLRSAERETQPFDQLSRGCARTAVLSGTMATPGRSISRSALRKCLAAIDALPPGTKALVAVHHPLREVGTTGTALTINGKRALAELARRPVLGVLSGHVHDPFDILEQTPAGPVRMIGAGTLSQRLRSTPPSFNEITWDGQTLTVRVRSLDEVPTRDMQIDDVPEDALPPRQPGDPVAAVNQVPRTDPPVH